MIMSKSTLNIAPDLTANLHTILAQAERVLTRLESYFPTTINEPDWQNAVAFRWRKYYGRGTLQAAHHISSIRLSDLQHIELQKQRILQNTQQFVQGYPANNVLLTGARGTGKSSLIKACLNEFSAQGLRLIEVDKNDLIDLPDIVDLIAERSEYFILFCDDLSFEANDPSYKMLKAALDGSVSTPSHNLLIYATSNRRHLLPEMLRENLSYEHQEDGEIHPGESIEEKISLSERFGLWLSFYPFRQEDYLAIVTHWLSHFGCSASQIEAARDDALRFTIERGSRSGRVAWQFSKHWAGLNRIKPSAKK